MEIFSAIAFYQRLMFFPGSVLDGCLIHASFSLFVITFSFFIACFSGSAFAFFFFIGCFSVLAFDFFFDLSCFLFPAWSAGEGVNTLVSSFSFFHSFNGFCLIAF